MASLRVGLTQRLEWLESRGEMREMLDVAWGEGLAKLGAVALALPVRGLAPGKLIEAYALDALILTGGNETGSAATDRASKERNACEALLLHAAQDARLPVLGVCHGMQGMNVYLGGGVSPIEQHVRAPHAIEGAAAAVLGVRRSNSFHNIAIQSRELAPAWLAAGRAPDGSIEVAVHPALPWLGVMWHPERQMPDGVDGMSVVGAFLADPAGLCARLREKATA